MLWSLSLVSVPTLRFRWWSGLKLVKWMWLKSNLSVALKASKVKQTKYHRCSLHWSNSRQAIVRVRSCWYRSPNESRKITVHWLIRFWLEGDEARWKYTALKVLTSARSRWPWRMLGRGSAHVTMLRRTGVAGTIFMAYKILEQLNEILEQAQEQERLHLKSRLIRY